MILSREALETFANLLGQVSISANAPDIEEQAAKIARVRGELEAALADVDRSSGDG